MIPARCDKCKFWSHNRTKSAAYSPDPEVYTRRGAPTGYNWVWDEYGECCAIEHPGERKRKGDWRTDRPAQLRLAVVLDWEDYGANLWTRAEFGCVLFEQTEP